MNTEEPTFECAECERETPVGERTYGRPNVCQRCSGVYKNNTLRRSSPITGDTIISTTRPPIGLKTRWLVTESRLKDISEAIERYKAAGLPPDEEWYAEFFDLHTWLVRYRKEKFCNGK